MIGLFARLNLWHSHVCFAPLYLGFVVYYGGGSLRRVPIGATSPTSKKNTTPVNTEVLWGVLRPIAPAMFHQPFFDFFHLVKSTITITRQPTAARSE